MNILVNASTAVVGGAVQVAASFIERALREPRGHVFRFAVSPAVANQVGALCGSVGNEVHITCPSPAKPLSGYRARLSLKNFVNDSSPDLVYSIASPSYMDFRPIPEVARSTNGFISHPSRMAWSRFSFPARVKQKILMSYKAYLLRRCQGIHTQSIVAARGLEKRLHLSQGTVDVIPNCANELFQCEEDIENRADVNRSRSGEWKILSLAHPYPHKNLDLIPEVAVILKNKGVSAKFYMTIPETDTNAVKILRLAERMGVSDSIINAGVVDLGHSRELFRQCNLLFLPTLLETFSATYLEAMMCGCPIVTTDLSFARDQCNDAAEYFTPMHADSAAQAILKVMGEAARYEELVAAGRRNLKRFPTPEAQYHLQLAWLCKIYRELHGS